MRDLKLNYKFMIMFSIAVSTFNYTLDAGSEYGFFTLIMTFLFLYFWINYIVYRLGAKSSNKKECLFSEIYFSLMITFAILMLSTLIFNYSLGEILSSIIMFLISPINGIRFLLRPLIAWNLLVIIILVFIVFIIRSLTKEV